MPTGPGPMDGCQRVVLADPEIDYATNIIGNVSSLDAGPAWAVQNGIGGAAIESGDATAGLNLTSEIVAEQVIYITDIIISSDTEMKITIQEATNDVAGTNIIVLYVPANFVGQITPRSFIQVTGAAGKKVRAVASAAGNISITFLYKTNI